MSAGAVGIVVMRGALSYYEATRQWAREHWHELSPIKKKVFKIWLKRMKSQEKGAIMKGSLLFKLIKWSRALRIALGGYKGMEKKHKLFQLPAPLTPREIYHKLLMDCYQYNALSTTYKKQIFTVRKLTDLDHQLHLRFYSDGWVSGHSELQPEQFPMEHLQGKDLRALTDGEREKLWRQLRPPRNAYQRA